MPGTERKDYVQFSVKLDDPSTLDGNTLSGVAHTFGTKTMRYGQWEVLSPTVFDKVFKSPQTDARAFVNHNPDLLLGRQSVKTLTVEVSDGALRYSIDLPNTSYANDLKESVRRGDLDGVSFGFVPGKWTESSDANGVVTRLHTEAAQFVDISPCALPAFGGTSVELRADELQDLMNAAAPPAAPAEPIPAAVGPSARETALRIRNRGISRK